MEMHEKAIAYVFRHCCFICIVTIFMKEIINVIRCNNFWTTVYTSSTYRNKSLKNCKVNLLLWIKSTIIYKKRIWYLLFPKSRDIDITVMSNIQGFLKWTIWYQIKCFCGNHLMPMIKCSTSWHLQDPKMTKLSISYKIHLYHPPADNLYKS